MSSDADDQMQPEDWEGKDAGEPSNGPPDHGKTAEKVEPSESGEGDPRSR